VGLSVGLYDPDESYDVKTVAVDDLGTLVARFERGEFDLVGVGRALLNDPAWTRKARLGDGFEPYDPASMRGVAR
jgi:2,4-dienoyl-CoA reductase-like NADH-dependent reductase (Old Yellow Enzyme family)